MNAIIIDDHPLARIAIRSLLDSNGITVAAELDSGAHAPCRPREACRPDLLIVDVDIPELSGYRGAGAAAQAPLLPGEQSSSFPLRMNCSTANAAPTAEQMVFVSKKEERNDNILAAIDAANNG